MVEWDDDQRYRVVRPEETDLDDDDPDWETWGSDEDFVYARDGQVRPGESSEPTWWLVYGEAAAGDTIDMWLADGKNVAVMRIHGLWVGEWISLPQAAFIRINNVVTSAPARRPAYLPPAQFDFDRKVVDPRVIGGHQQHRRHLVS